MNKSSENAKSCSLPMAHGIALITVYAMVCILGSFGKLLLCFAIANHPLLRRTSNYLLFSLAIADLFVTLVCEPVLLEIFYNRTFFSRMQGKPGKAVSSYSQSFFLILYDRSISAQVQEEKKGPKSPNAFRKVYFAQGGPCCLHLSYCNRRFYSLLGSGKDYEVCHRYEAKQPFTHVAPDLGSVKLSHEFSDLLCKNACLQRGILKYLSKDVSLVEFRVRFGLNIHQSTFLSLHVIDACLLNS